MRMPTTLHRAFEVRAPCARAWEHLARPSEWPSWAKHIASVEMTPPGAITPTSAGVIRLSNGIRSRFAMTSIVPGERWTWEGGFLWMHVVYDHAFDAIAPDRTRIRFDVAVTGFGRATLGRLFRRIYAKNLDRAIPNLVAEMEGRPASS
jgi:hypothetical protein